MFKINEKPTIKDIARLSNSSIATVSRVLNNVDYPVSNELRESILKVAKELNYKPNIYGRMLKGGQSKEIGLLIPNISNPFYSELVSGVERICIKRGYTPIICSSYNDKKLEKKHLDTLLMKKVDGILASIIGDSADIIREMKLENSKYVLFDQNHNDDSCYSISYDFENSGFIAASYLLNQGLEKIAFLSTPFDRKSRQEIFEGFKRAFRLKGKTFSEDYLIVEGLPENEIEQNAEIQNGIHLTKIMLQKIGKPEAIVAINDITALGVIQELANRKITVPDDISLISFDDIPLAEMVTPKLTTVRQPAFQIGKIGANMLIDRIENMYEGKKSIIIEPELIVRKTVMEKE
ncbi:LacI family DNA-binding transcriptional regulator [Proteiniclasticum sp. SCR006]|uniref:LacI family DNA-binding transcriptional regulator n=1 Tax=Proteiniclasticum aestuarii TaxID=2817862 RepID=A0A939HAB8_9CLOT|nr:LacI family DNA-binding transcriptional regulator [Proteiniclasticum aestuarii]